MHRRPNILLNLLVRLHLRSREVLRCNQVLQRVCVSQVGSHGEAAFQGVKVAGVAKVAKVDFGLREGIARLDAWCTMPGRFDCNVMGRVLESNFDCSVMGRELDSFDCAT